MRAEKQWEAEAVAMLIIGVCFSIVAAAIAVQLLKNTVPDLKATDARFYNHLIYSACTQGISLALSHLLLRRHGVGWRELIGLDDPRWLRAVSVGLLTAVAALPVVVGLNQLCKWLIELFQENAAQQPAMLVLQVADTLPRQLAFGFITIIAAPLVEEILFRGIAYRALRDRLSPAAAVVLSSLLFGVIHVNLMTLFPLSVFGVILALLYERTGNLLAPIATHALFNAVNLSYFLYAAK